LGQAAAGRGERTSDTSARLARDFELDAELCSANFRHFNTRAAADESAASPLAAIAEGAPS